MIIHTTIQKINFHILTQNTNISKLQIQGYQRIDTFARYHIAVFL